MSKKTKTDKLVQANKLMTSVKAIDKAIAKAIVTTAELRLEYQRIACSVIKHVAKHGDVRVLNRMIDSMQDKETRTSALNVNAMREFVLKYGTVTYDTEENKFCYAKKKELQLGLALENGWWLARPVKPFVPFDLIGQLDKLITTAENKYTAEQKREQDAKKGEYVTLGDIIKLREFTSSLKSKNVA